ncbi:MAG TPA: (Fe-S)-binding protein [Gallionella sp.]|nr:(Fe-S)-binding protein [Gallionella sp.]
MSATLSKGINAFKEVIDAPIASYFSSCVHCGLCADACLFYNETGEKKYTPIHKVEPLRRVWRQEYTLLGRIGKLLGLHKPVTDAELTEWEPLVYDSCTLCGRCSLVCPVGNDITYMIRKMREGMAASGHAPPDLVAATTRAVTIGSPMGVKWATVQAQIKHVQAETGIEVPVERTGVDYLVLMSSMEVVNFPEYLAALARIFKETGVTWTLAQDAFEATNSGVQIGVSDLAREIVSRIVVTAERLQVKGVLSPECGHAYAALRWEGPNLMGRPFGFEVKHVLELLDELQAAGKLKTRGMDQRPLTYHDPCQIARRGGVVEPPRRLLGMIAADFREMPETGVNNWCCGGGGGVAANTRADPLRLEAFKVKKRQIEATGTQTLVTACANCRIVLEEGIEHYHMKVDVIGLTELLGKYLAEERNP